MRLCGRAGVLLGFPVLSPTGSAHTPLKTSSPVAGATLASAPTKVRRQFHEPIEATPSQDGVKTNAGQAVAAGAAADPRDNTAPLLRLPAPPKPGAYKVTWRVMSADSHEGKGSVTFQVRP
jgi:methionine-rich copper-binding protein CopC